MILDLTEEETALLRELDASSTATGTSVAPHPNHEGDPFQNQT
jgi:hypothetical protein